MRNKIHKVQVLDSVNSGGGETILQASLFASHKPSTVVL